MFELNLTTLYNNLFVRSDIGTNGKIYISIEYG